MTSLRQPKFPCPVCGIALQVRQTKKQKPYIVCDPCGLQMFVRGASGIGRFEGLLSHAQSGNALDKLAEMERRYRKKCLKCGKPFWIGPELMETGWFDGGLIGWKCPEKGCGGVVKVEA